MTDKRVRVMNEIISGMRLIKIYAWEWAFHEYVKKIRKLVYHHYHDLFFSKLPYLNVSFVQYTSFVQYDVLVSKPAPVVSNWLKLKQDSNEFSS